MARSFGSRDVTPVLNAADFWIDHCLIGDGAVFSDEKLWSSATVGEARAAFVENLDAGEGTFFEKLRGQLVNATPRAKRLMAEMLWAARLFPSNIKPATKRRQVMEVHSTSGVAIPVGHKFLENDVLQGIGSAGPGFNNHFWRELVFIISLVESLKRMPEPQRRATLKTYDSFISWIDEVPQEGYQTTT
jgi:5-methylcytosine-specific restriction enzyme B